MDQTTFSEVWWAREAAGWAAVAAVAAWVFGITSIALTGGGLIFVWRQLKVAELNAKAAVEAAHAALLAGRPWLEISLAPEGKIHRWYSQPGRISLQIALDVHNIGKAPALDVRTHLVPVDESTWRSDPEMLADRYLNKGFLSGVVVPNGSVQPDVAYGFQDPQAPIQHVMIIASYQIPGLAARRYSARLYSVFESPKAASNDEAGIVWSAMASPVFHSRTLMT